MTSRILLFCLTCLPLGHAQTSSSTSLFDGKTLQGWEVTHTDHARFWSVVNGVITCGNGDQKMPTNTYLATDKEYENFIFTCDFRLSGDHATGLINSGIQYRTELHETQRKGAWKVIGYQADIGKGYWGDLYDEHRRGKLAGGNTKNLFKQFKEDGWNTYKIVCKGDHHRLYINDHLTVDYTEKNPKIPGRGYFALQLHSGGVAKMEYKNIRIQELK